MEIRMLGVGKVVSICQELSSSVSSNLSALTTSHNGEHSSESASDTSLTVHIFDLASFCKICQTLSKINQTTDSFDKMMNLNSRQQQPPTI